MDEATVRKIGEVMAAARVSTETVERTRNVLEQVFGKYKVKEILHDNNRAITQMEVVSKATKVHDQVLQHAQSAEQSIKKLRESLLTSNEDIPAVLHWFGFAAGSAFVHWNILLGNAQAAKMKDLELYAQQGASMHDSFLRLIGEAAQKYKR